MTLKSAFTEVFGEALEKHGFVKIKGTQPYFVRAVNHEILHIITYAKETAYTAYGTKCTAFNIWGAAATVYRKKIDFVTDVKKQNTWFNSLFDFYVRTSMYHDYQYHTADKLYTFRYTPETMISVVRNALAMSEQYMMPVLDKVTNLDSAMNYFLQYNSIAIGVHDQEHFCNDRFCQEGLLLFQNFNSENFEIFFHDRAELIRTANPGELKDFEHWKTEILTDRNQVLSNPERYLEAVNELNVRKEANTAMLLSYGIDLRD